MYISEYVKKIDFSKKLHSFALLRRGETHVEHYGVQER